MTRFTRFRSPRVQVSHRSDQHWIDLDTVYRSVVRAATFFGVPIGNSLQMSTLAILKSAPPDAIRPFCVGKTDDPADDNAELPVQTSSMFFSIVRAEDIWNRPLGRTGIFSSRLDTKSRHITSSARSGILGFV